MIGRAVRRTVAVTLIGLVPTLIGTSAAHAAANPTLTVGVSGEGSVTSADGQIDCPKVCSTTGYKPGTTVELTAHAPDGWQFAKWDPCSTTKPTCSFEIKSDVTVTASFEYIGLGDTGALDPGELVADGPSGGTAKVKLKALVANKAPTAKISGPGTVTAGTSVNLSASASKDPDGTVAGYEWDLNGDGVFDDGFAARVPFRSMAPGKHAVGLEVADNDGRTDATARIITVVANKHLISTADRLASEGGARTLQGSFSKKLSGWRAFGAAFGDPVQSSKWVSASRVLDTNGRLNGSYTNGVRVNVGSTGAWISSYRSTKTAGLSANAAAAQATGELISQPFTITRKYLSFRLGAGGVGVSGARFEVWVRQHKGWQRMRSVSAGSDADVMRPAVIDLAKVKGSRGAVAVIDNSTTSWLDVDTIEQVAHRPRTAQDSSYFRIAPKDRTRFVAPAPVVGLADFHSHPAAAQGFGALQGIRAYMGTVGGDVGYYDTHPAAYAHDVYGDDVYHFGGPLAKFGIDLAEGRVSRDDTISALASLIGSHVHPRYGGTCSSANAVANGACDDSGHQPGTIGPAHEQMNVFEIHRAWQGGLRLLSSLSINSAVLEYLGGYPRRYDGGPPETDVFGAPTEHDGDQSVNQIRLTSEAKIIAAQVEGMRELATLNSSWMQIAYNPQQAYDIVRSGKLAIVLGTEIDTTGSLGLGSAAEEVNWLWQLGIRQVTPIHCCDSRIGGTALFQDAYNTANDFQNRPTKDITAIRASDDFTDQGLGIAPKPGASSSPQIGFFLNAVSGCAPPNNVRGECIDWRFDTPNAIGASSAPFGKQSVAVVDGTALTVPALVGSTVHPAPYDRFPNESYGYYDDVDGGMRNPKGLTDYGRAYIEALMHRGMLLDLEHMSEQTIDDLVDPGTDVGHARGPVWAFDQGATCSVTNDFTTPVRPNDCWSDAYPLMSSHTSFRAQSLQPGETQTKGFLSREFERSSNQIEYIRRSGGVLGPVVLQDPVDTVSARVSSATHPTWQHIDDYDWPTTSTPHNSCAGSSESWAQAYLYGLQKMGGKGVGVGTDMLLVGGTAPRFGASAPAHLGSIYACDDSREATSRESEELSDPSQYQRSAQHSPVEYGGAFALYSPRSPTLRPDVDPAGVDKDFNKMGMVAYAELPDLLQDATNVGVTAHDMTPLFSSAQSYVDMWGKAYDLAGCYGDNFDTCGATPAPPANRDEVCQGTCPLDSGRGLGNSPDGHPYVVMVAARIAR